MCCCCCCCWWRFYLGVLDVCCDLASPAKSWCKKYCEVHNSHLMCYREQSDATAEIKLPLYDTPVYVCDKAFTLIHMGQQYGFRVRYSTTTTTTTTTNNNNNNNKKLSYRSASAMRKRPFKVIQCRLLLCQSTQHDFILALNSNLTGRLKIREWKMQE